MKGLLAALMVVYMMAVVCLSLGSLALSIYGICLAFSASIILGIIVLFIQPAPFIIGLVMFFLEKNLAQEIMNWINN